MKDTMNKSDIALFHKMLANKDSSTEISKTLKVSVATLKKFTPEKIEEAKKKNAERLKRKAKPVSNEKSGD